VKVVFAVYRAVFAVYRPVRGCVRHLLPGVQRWHCSEGCREAARDEKHTPLPPLRVKPSAEASMTNDNERQRTPRNRELCSGQNRGQEAGSVERANRVFNRGSETVER